MRIYKAIASLTILTLFMASLWTTVSAQTEESQVPDDFVPGEDSGFFYTIKKGDTLWDLSQRFYNSEWDWPGLWELNDQIKNPHWIYPGKKIRIFLKERAPLKPKVVEVKKLPPKPPKKVKPSFSFSAMDHVGFLRKKTEPSLGKIIKGKDGKLLIGKYDIIYIKPSGSGTLVPGKIYHVFSTTPVSASLDNQRFSGIRHQIRAKIKVLEHKVSYVTAEVLNSYREVRTGDMIMEYFERESVLTVDNTPEPIDARIVCSEDDHLMINDYIIAFINKGKNEVKPGQIYQVKQKNELEDTHQWPPKKGAASIKLESLQSGKLIILHTEDISSTVMILSSKYAIHPNDMVN